MNGLQSASRYKDLTHRAFTDSPATATRRQQQSLPLAVTFFLFDFSFSRHRLALLTTQELVSRSLYTLYLIHSLPLPTTKHDIMISKAFMVAALIAYVDARFGQEQVPISAISAVKGGASGAAATVAGAAISDLLGGANSCAKVQPNPIFSSPQM